MLFLRRERAALRLRYEMAARIQHTPAKTKNTHDPGESCASHPRKAHASALAIQPIHGGNRAQKYSDNRVSAFPAQYRHALEEARRRVLRGEMRVWALSSGMAMSLSDRPHP
jgi:hypothetical protein